MFVENEDDVQRLFDIFNPANRQYSINFSEKTKMHIHSMEPLRCKLDIDGPIINQKIKFELLGTYDIYQSMEILKSTDRIN